MISLFFMDSTCCNLLKKREIYKRTTVGLRSVIKKKILQVYTSNESSKMVKLFEEHYGEFDKNNYENHTVTNLPSESKIYHGEMIKWAADIKPQNVLFAGENKKTIQYLQKIIDAKNVYCVGLVDSDYRWDFEKKPPEIEIDFDLIVTQAILEHLINPYKHIQDLSSLASPKGYILIHTVMPGFYYHRYPIDSIRFFPDWFEEVAKRLSLRIIKKRIRDSHIFYLYQKHEI